MHIQGKSARGQSPLTEFSLRQLEKYCAFLMTMLFDRGCGVGKTSNGALPYTFSAQSSPPEQLLFWSGKKHSAFPRHDLHGLDYTRDDCSHPRMIITIIISQHPRRKHQERRTGKKSVVFLFFARQRRRYFAALMSTIPTTVFS